MPLQEDELKAAIRAQDRDKIKKILAARAGHGRLNVVRDVLHAGVKRDPTKFSNSRNAGPHSTFLAAAPRSDA
jgi:hypothetical protein